MEYKTAPFAGKADKTTVLALNAFQFRNGLLQTDGVLDAVTLDMLGLPPLGPDVFLPLAGPYCAIDVPSDAALCAIPHDRQRTAIGTLLQTPAHRTAAAGLR